MNKKILTGAIAAGTLLAVPALANDELDRDLYGEPSYDVVQPGDERRTGYEPVVIDDQDTTIEFVEEEEESGDMRGLTLMLGGGVEGYTGGLAPRLEAGPSYGVTAAIKPSRVLGIELGFSGGMNEFDGVGGSGYDMVRNGGHVAATLGLNSAALQPYVLGGVGLNHYNVRAEGQGFQDDTSGYIPVGAGLRTHIGNFTADLRGTYGVLFNDDFAAGQVGDQDVAGVEVSNGGRYGATLNIGTTF